MLLTCALGLAGVAGASPAPGDLDLSFGKAGNALGSSFSSEASTRMAIGPRGEIFVLEPNMANCFFGSRCDATLKVARYGRNGARDPVFGAAAKLEVTQHQYQDSDIAVGPDGKPVVAAIDGQEGVVVARFGQDGLPDAAFGRAGVTAPLGEAAGTPPVVAVQADGKVVVAFEASSTVTFDPSGDFTRHGHLTLARFLVDGTLDPSFGTAGKVTVDTDQSRPAGLAFRGGGGFDIGLSQCCMGAGGDGPTVAVNRFLSNGSLDPSLTSGGQALIPRPQGDAFIEAISAAPGGRVYLVANEERRGSVAIRLLPDGRLDPSFGKGGEVVLGRRVGVATNVTGISTDSAGRLVGVGHGARAFRLLPDGRPDRTFGAGWGALIHHRGVNLNDSGFGLQPGDRMVVLVEVGFAAGRSYFLARFNAGSSRVRCLGERATIVGTWEAQEIVGTQGRDVIAAMGGADTVRGMGGPDLICGGKGRDKIFGGAGKNLIRQ